MTITITGLEPHDVLLCDLLWACDSQASVDRLIANMPAGAQRRAQVMRELMTAAVFDDVVEVEDHVRDYIATL